MLGALALLPLLRRLRLPSEGLYPVLTLVLAGALYGVTSLAHGSGFLAVFIAGLFLGDARMPFKGEIERFSGSLASLAELVVFVALGLTIDIGGLTGRVWFEGIVLALALALIARPLVVLLTLGPARLSWAERAFITWSGLKGGRCRSCLPRSPCSPRSPGRNVSTGSCSSSCSCRSWAKGRWCR